MPIRIASKKSSSTNKLPSIKCSSCGAEIVSIQNVKLVSEAIEAYVESHRVKDQQSHKVRGGCRTHTG